MLGAEAKSDKDLEGDRTITAAYVSDAQGNKVADGQSGHYVTL